MCVCVCVCVCVYVWTDRQTDRHGFSISNKTIWSMGLTQNAPAFPCVLLQADVAGKLAALGSELEETRRQLVEAHTEIVQASRAE